MSSGELLLDGLMLMGTGMAVVFVVLAILMGVIRLLESLPARGEKPERQAKERAKTLEVEGEVVAAIAVALASALKVSARRRLAPHPPSQPGHWASSGRRQLMESRQRVKR